MHSGACITISDTTNAFLLGCVRGPRAGVRRIKNSMHYFRRLKLAANNIFAMHPKLKLG